MATSQAHRTLPKAVLDGVYRTIDPLLTVRANGKGICSTKTRHERRQFYLQMVAQLWELGFRIRKLESLAGKHVTALMQHWYQQGVSVGTLHTRRSMVNHLCNYLGKLNLVKDITDYFPADEVRRKTICKESKAWKAHGVNPLEVIELAKQIDERLAVILAIQHHFGLRVKESIEFRPGNAMVNSGRSLSLHEGTKGGRPRLVALRTKAQKEVYDWACRVASSGNTKRLRWTDCTWKQAQNRFYHLVRYRLGISRKTLGVTAHGLRHGFSHDTYRRETGMPSPIEGGALGRIDRQTHYAASLSVSNELGHGRTDVTTSYYGSYGHQLRMSPVSKMSFSFPSMNYPLPA